CKGLPGNKKCSLDNSLACEQDDDCKVGPCSDQAVDQLFADFLQVADGVLSEASLIQLLYADDDDLNLLNGTPHGCDIMCAFVGAERLETECTFPEAWPSCGDCDEVGHGWACPLLGTGGDGGVRVTWDQSPAPEAGQDYIVEYAMDPPAVILTSKTATGGATVTEWTIARYFDGWCDGGENYGRRCNGPEDCPDAQCRGQCDGGDNPGAPCTNDTDCVGGGTCSLDVEPAALNIITAEWAGAGAYSIDVVLGTAVAPLFSVGVVDIPRQGPDNYVSIALDLVANITGSLTARANTDGEGGRISGNVPGQGSFTWAEAIGTGGSVPSTLAFGSTPRYIWLETLPSGSQLDSGCLESKNSAVTIAGELEGMINVASYMRGFITINGESDSIGNIIVGEELFRSTLYDVVKVAGNMAGTITAGSRIDNTNDGYAVRIGGDLSGSILAGTDIGTEDRTAIFIGGDMTGRIIADADRDGDGEITGDIEIVGEFDGDICDAGLYPGMTQAVLATERPNITVGTWGANATVCSGGPQAAPAPHDTRKNRYISLVPAKNPETEVALRVELVEMKRCTGDTSKSCTGDGDCTGVGACANHADVGETWWVAEPDANGVAHLSDTPVYRYWTEPVVHIGDCPIIPVATYAVRATRDGVLFSDPLEIGTILKPGVWHYGDVAGDGTGELPPAIGFTPPNQIVNVNDVTAYLLTAKGDQTPSAPLTWVDLHGMSAQVCSVDTTRLCCGVLGVGGCDDPEDCCPVGQTCDYVPSPTGFIPNQILNVSDLQRILFGLEGQTYTFADGQVTPASCNVYGTPPACGKSLLAGDDVTLTLVPNDDIIDAQQSVEVDIYVDSVDDLGAFELALEVTGGTSGELLLTDVSVDSQRQDYVFGTATAYNAENLTKGTLSNSLASGSVQVTGSGYLATYTFQPSGGASGVFNVSIKGGENSFLCEGDGTVQGVNVDDTALIGVGIDCFDNEDCDDNNDCTTDTCSNYECSYGNVSQGTSCDDGMFCTKTDECDGNGNCTGSGVKCPQFNPVCCEEGDYCTCSTCQCAGQ
ncbi:MAG: hypothetical protein JSU63_21905, partial [Phycisphaerales bacterium]